MARRRKAGAADADVVHTPPANEVMLALDTSSVCVGWAVFRGGKLASHGRYKQQGESHSERLAHFRHWVLAMLAQHTPHHMIYERPFAGRRRNTFGVLSLYVAVVLLSHWEYYGTAFPDANSVPARDVKRLNRMRKGKNHEQNKKLGVLLANRLYGLRLKYKSNDKTKRVSQDDQADAILLGRAWLISERGLLADSDE